jgi:hypothetical protein
LKILSLGRDRRFGVRSYCVREERQVTLRLWSASALVSLHIFFSFNSEKMGIPRLPLTTHLPYPPLWPQLWDCTKNGQPCRRSSKSFKQKGEKLTQTLKHQRTMRVKRMKVAEGRRLNIGQFPNFHRSGSIRGMKKLYYGENCLLVRCGNYIYNVTSEPSIYNQATI